MAVISNIQVYDLEESLVASGYAMINDYDAKAVRSEILNLRVGQVIGTFETDRHYKRALKLTKAPLNSGHVSWAKGVVVNMDITFTNKAWIELQRYHFIDIITGQSCMHRISKFNLDDAFNEYVDRNIIIHLKAIQKEYNENPTPENYLRLLYSTPSGIYLTGRVTTNYLQLLNIYKQRRTHRLPEWREFCKELLDLPMFYELLEANGSLYSEDIRSEG
jgi:hypothetical protein